jgi:hypothetical protein
LLTTVFISSPYAKYVPMRVTSHILLNRLITLITLEDVAAILAQHVLLTVLTCIAQEYAIPIILGLGPQATAARAKLASCHDLDPSSMRRDCAREGSARIVAILGPEARASAGLQAITTPKALYAGAHNMP